MCGEKSAWLRGKPLAGKYDLGGSVVLRRSPHDETLLGQNQLAQLGSLQSVHRAVVNDRDGLVAAQKLLAFDQTGRHRRALCVHSFVSGECRAGGLLAGVHGSDWVESS